MCKDLETSRVRLFLKHAGFKTKLRIDPERIETHSENLRSKARINSAVLTKQLHPLKVWCIINKCLIMTGGVLKRFVGKAAPIFCPRLSALTKVMTSRASRVHGTSNTAAQHPFR